MLTRLATLGQLIAKTFLLYDLLGLFFQNRNSRWETVKV